MPRSLNGVSCLLALSIAAAAAAQVSTPPAAPPPLTPVPLVPEVEDPYPPSVVELLRAEAARLIGEVRSAEARRFLIGTSYLEMRGDRGLYTHKQTRKILNSDEIAVVPEAEHKDYEYRVYSEKEYYYTRYGSPLAYIRPVELACEYLGGGWSPLTGKRILDFGYGGIGHLRLLAQLGIDVVGVDVDPMLRALYAGAGDEGEVPGILVGEKTLPDGTLTLVHGRWPADADAIEAVGEGFDLILSKNTLKNGYINPEKPVDKRMLVNLGVTNDEFVKRIAAALKPGGVFLIYNICPAQKPEPEKWIPWADGRSPFSREMLEGAGLEVLDFDKEDDEASRRVARALEWDKQGMDVDGDLYTWYTAARKPVAPAPPSPPAVTPTLP